MTSRLSRIDPGVVTRVLARPNLTHVALQIELLLAEVRELDRHSEPRKGIGLAQQDIDQLHTMVANCLLFLGSGPPPTR